MVIGAMELLLPKNKADKTMELDEIQLYLLNEVSIMVVNYLLVHDINEYMASYNRPKQH